MNILEIIKDFCGTEKVETLEGEFNVNALNELVSSSDREIIEKSYKNVEMLEKMVTSPKHVTKIPRKKQVEPTAIEYNNKETHNVKNKEDREKNIIGVYEIENIHKISDKKVLLLDDIITTGSTANECAKMLLTAKPKKIGVLTIAKD